jgi:hypothetical protein
MILWRLPYPKGHCQSKLNQSLKSEKLGNSGCKLAPFSERDSAVLLENVAAVEVAVTIEVIVYRRMDGGKRLQSLDIPEPCHRSLSSSKRLV